MNIPNQRPARPIRIGLQANSIDPFWVEVRECISHSCQQPRAFVAESLGAAQGSHSRNGNALHAPASAPLTVSQPMHIDLVEIEVARTLEGDDYAERAEEIMALELDALIAIPVSMPFIQMLLDQGLPVIALHNRDLRHELFSCPVGLYPSARMACLHLTNALHNRGRVLIVGGLHEYSREAPSTRLQAAIDIFSQLPEIEWVRVPAPWDREGAVAALRAELADETRPFDGIFGLSDSLALAGRDVAAQRGLLRPHGAVVGINGDPLAIAAVATGSMTATVATSATALAEESLRIACLAALRQPIPAYFAYRPQLVTADNVADVALRRLVHIADLPSRLVGANRRQEEARLAWLETSIAINQRIGSILDRGTLLHEITHLISSRYGYDQVHVYLWDAQQHCLVLEAPDLADDARTKIQLAEATIPGRAFLRNRPIFLPDVLTSYRFDKDAAAPNTRSRTAMPIRLGTRTVGVLDLHSLRVLHHSQSELDALQVLADQVGIGLENSKLYTEALAARAAAERADSLKTRLLTNISHELRAPLNTILGYSQVALSNPNPYGAALPESLLADLQRVQRSGQQLVQLVDDLLSLSQAEIGALEIVPEEFAIDELLSELFQLFASSEAPATEDARPANHSANADAAAPAHDKRTVRNETRRGKVTWRLLLPADVPRIPGDPVRLRQVFLDILSNAQKFTARGYVELGAIVEAQNLHVWVADTGIGIEPAQQQQLHLAFAAGNHTAGDHTAADNTRAEHAQPRSGMGLGLSVAHHILALHGGSLCIESEPAQGTICHVRLPLKLAAPLGGETTATQASSIAQSSNPESIRKVLDCVLEHASDMTREIADYLIENYAVNLSREEIAAAMRVSPDYVSRVFRKDTGMTPWQYLNRYRVLQAQHLLLTTTRTITEIAGEVGFNDAAYFVRVFHRETGRSPQRYRKTAKLN